MWIKYSLWNPKHLLGTDTAGPGTLVVLKGKLTISSPNSWGWLLYNISTLSLLSMSQGIIFSVVPCPTALTGMAGLHRALLMCRVFTAEKQLELPVVAGMAKPSRSILYFWGKKCEQSVSRAKRYESLGEQKECQNLLLWEDKISVLSPFSSREPMLLSCHIFPAQPMCPWSLLLCSLLFSRCECQNIVA